MKRGFKYSLYLRPGFLADTMLAVTLFFALLIGIYFSVFIVRPLLQGKSANESKIQETGHPLISACHGQINGTINDKTLEWFRKWISEVNRDGDCKKAILTITSFGGSTNVAYEIISLMSLSQKHINTSCLSYCSSAAIIILAHGTGTRYVSEFTNGFIHQPGFSDERNPKLLRHGYETFYNRFLPLLSEEIREKITLGEDVALTAHDYVKYGLADTLITVPKLFAEDKVVDLEPYIQKSLAEKELVLQSTSNPVDISAPIKNQGPLSYALYLRYSIDDASRVCLNASLVTAGSDGNRQEIFCYSAKSPPKLNNGFYNEVSFQDLYTARDYFVWDYANNYVCSGTIVVGKNGTEGRSLSFACEKTKYVDKEIFAYLGTVLVNKTVPAKNGARSYRELQSINDIQIRYYTDNSSYTCITTISNKSLKTGKIVATDCYSSFQKPVMEANISEDTNNSASVFTDIKIKDVANNTSCVVSQIGAPGSNVENASLSLSCLR